MSGSSRGFLSGFASLAVSLLINSAVFFSVDRAISAQGTHSWMRPQNMAGQKKEIVQFEFVEAPPRPSPAKPQKTRKIAEHDSRAQDLTQSAVAKEASSPKIAVRGASDQLAQRPGTGAPSPASLPQPEKKEAEKSKASSEPPKAVEPDEATALSIKKPDPVQAAQDRPQTPSPAQNSAPWVPGRGKILTQEISKTRSAGAKFLGEASFEATGSGMGVYMKNLKEKIWVEWFPYVAFKFPRDFKSADAVVEFSLNSHGKVKSAKVIQSKGSPLFAAFCVEAVKHAADFGELPKELLDLTGKDEITISFAFHYS